MSFEFDLENQNEVNGSEVKQQKKVFCKCKKCGSDIIELPLFFACANYCGVKVWKEFLYKQLTVQEIRALLEGKEIYLTELKSSSGKIFNAYARYDFDQCKVILRFENSNKQDKQNKQSKDSKQNKQESKQKKSKK